MDSTIQSELLGNTKKKSFREFCKYINTKRVLEYGTQFLKSYSVENVNPRVFLTIFLILHFKEHVLFNGELEDSLYFLVKEITNNLENSGEKIQKYKNLFNKWKNIDKEKQLKVYSETYHELEMLKLKNKHDEYKNNIEPLQKKILEKTNKLCKNGEKYIKQYNEIHNKLTVDLYNKLNTTMKKVYWRNLEKSLEKSKKNYSEIPKLLNDIKGKLYKLLPLKNEFREKLIQDLNECLDLEFLKSLCINASFDLQKIQNIGISVFEYILKTGMPARDSAIKKHIENIEKYTKDIPCLIYVLKHIFLEIEKIEKSVIYINHLNTNKKEHV